MPLIEEREARGLREHLEAHLTGAVTIELYTRPGTLIHVPGRQECLTCEETRGLLEEVAGLSPRIRLEVHDVDAEPERARAQGLEQVPAIVLRGEERGRVRYLGIPIGYEFASLLAALLDVANGTTDLAEESRAKLATLGRDVHIRVFVTPGCPFCPGAARLAHKMAVESARVTADVVEAAEFPDLVEKYGVQGVPKVVINDTVEFVGSRPESAFLAEVMRAAA